MSKYVNCQNCANKECSLYGKNYGYTFCNCFKMQRKITNADRIRSMTDEQLLDFMVKTIGNAVMCQALGTDPKFCTLEWLQSPAEDGE